MHSFSTEPAFLCKARFIFYRGKKFFIKGVTYGPFEPAHPTEIFLPNVETVKKDLALMSEMGVNVVRVYHSPPIWFLDLLNEFDLKAMITIPWQQHIDFLRDRKTVAEIRNRIRQSTTLLSTHPALFALLVGNEIPSDIVRWRGVKAVTRFIDDLVRLAKDITPQTLISYASYPPTESIIPEEVDFVTFNLFLHHQKDFQAYIARLHHLVGEKPLVVGEFGMDTLRHGEETQAQLLGQHVQDVVQLGLAGTILFSWTDQWFTGGQEILDWNFGLVTKERSKKKSFHRIQKIWTQPDWRLPLPRHPRVSIVVCSYNGVQTIEETLKSLDRLNYPHYEIILVDDGSTDETQKIVQSHITSRHLSNGLDTERSWPPFKNITQPNMGLSAARNRGIEAADGEIVAFTDSDCIVDEDWLHYLIGTLLQQDAAAVGGPNISIPTKNSIQAAVAAAPGSPGHVLISDSVAEHVPGCNMAFWKWVLEELHGFDADFRKAGDDVDICWRLIRLGHSIAFSPSAVVWHYRRFTMGAYFAQQKGYGEAEALLRFKHLNYFGPRGGIRWRGTVYGLPPMRAFLTEPMIYRGTFGFGLFQCIYPRGGSDWMHWVSSLEWLFMAGLIGILSIKIAGLQWITIIMLMLTLAASISWAIHARLESSFNKVTTRIVLFGLALFQPWIRSWTHILTWIQHKRTPVSSIAMKSSSTSSFWQGLMEQVFWSETGQTRLELLTKVADSLQKGEWKYSLDAGWGRWDLELFGSRWWQMRLRTMNEYHGGAKVLVRVGYYPLPTGMNLLILSGVLCSVLALWWYGSTVNISLVILAAAIVFEIYSFWNLRNRVGALVQSAAVQCGFFALGKKK